MGAGEGAVDDHRGDQASQAEAAQERGRLPVAVGDLVGHHERDEARVMCGMVRRPRSMRPRVSLIRFRTASASLAVTPRRACLNLRPPQRKQS